MDFLKKPGLLLFVLAAGHGVNDFVAGLLLHKSYSSSAVGDFTLVGIYGAIAFGAQLPLALLIDRVLTFRFWTQLAVGLNILSIAVSFFSLPAAIVFSGCASAIYHVSGGAMALGLENRFRGIAIGGFSAPGIIGLTAGTILPVDFSFWWIMPVLFLFLFILQIGNHPGSEEEQKTETKADFELHDALMLLILVISALRSAVWDIFQQLHYGNYTMLIWIGLAAAAGKFLGGFFASRVNTIHYLGFSMLLSLILLEVASKSQLALVSGIALLQSGIPGSILILKKILPGRPAFANASILGLAVFIGGVLFSSGEENFILLAFLAAGACAGMWLFTLLRKKRAANSKD